MDVLEQLPEQGKGPVNVDRKSTEVKGVRHENPQLRGYP